MKLRLDQMLVTRSLVLTRSQAESYIALGKVSVNGRVITKSGYFVAPDAEILLDQDEQFVSRAALKLKSVAEKLNLNFKGKVVLDIGSSTGGFTEFALSRGAKKVIAVDVGTDQLHPKLRHDPRIELHEKTDIRDFFLGKTGISADLPSKHRLGVGLSLQATARSSASRSLPAAQPWTAKSVEVPNIVLIDVSFISLREILPHVAKNLSDKNTQIVAMVKPQFETGARVKNAGVVKNDTERRKILKDFETWAKQFFIIQDKKDSEVAGATGNRERFYLLNTIAVLEKPSTRR